MFDVRKVAFAVHSGLGVSLALLLVVIFLSGALLSVSRDIDWLIKPELRVEAQDQPVQWQAMVGAVEERYRDGRLINILAPHREGFASIAEVRFPNRSVKRVFVNPYTGEIQGEEYRLYSVHRIVREFHRTLFFYPWGTYFITLLAVPLFVSVVAGLIHYREWWLGLWRLRAGTPAFAGDLHRLIGMWSVWFVVLISVTSLWYFAENYMARNNIRPSEAQFPVIPAEQIEAARAGAERASIDDMLTTARAAFPEMTVQIIMSPGPNRPVLFGGQADSRLTRNRGNYVLINPYDGQLVHKHQVSTQGPLERWAMAVDLLHAGEFAGWASKVVWIAFTLAVSAMMVVGLIVAGRRKGAEQGRERAIGPLRVTGLWLWATAAITSAAMAAGVYAFLHIDENTMSPLYSTREFGTERPR